MTNNKPMWFLVTYSDMTTRLVHGYRSDYKIGCGLYSSISTAHETIEELKAKRGIPETLCKHCNQIHSTSFNEPTGSRLRKTNTCFYCDLWIQQINRKEEQIIMGGVMYADGGKVDKLTTRGFVGFGGRDWKIQFNDGRILETNNMWCQGDIPARFRLLLPDNAKQLQISGK